MRTLLHLSLVILALTIGGCLSAVQDISTRNRANKALYLEDAPAKAAHLYEQAARNGDAESQYLLATLYLKGDGVTKDPAQYRDWMEKSAAQNYGPAMTLLGLDLVAGINGVSPDSKRGMALLRGAAVEEEDGGAHYILGLIYSRSTPDVKKDAYKAAHHFTMAEELGRAVDPQMKSAAAIERMDLPPFVAAPKSQVVSEPKAATIITTEVKKDVQRSLKELGYYTMAIDGDIGKGSIKAIKAFQRKAGLVPNGVIDNKLLTALKSAITARKNR